MALSTWSPELQNWLTQLRDAGVVPPETRRIIVDIPLNGLVSVYYECNADERMFSIDLAALLDSGNPVISVAEAAVTEADSTDGVIQDIVGPPDVLVGEDG